MGEKIPAVAQGEGRGFDPFPLCMPKCPWAQNQHTNRENTQTPEKEPWLNWDLNQDSSHRSKTSFTPESAGIHCFYYAI